jgi:CxxC motif-containing protein (DUF1111 family)
MVEAIEVIEEVLGVTFEFTPVDEEDTVNVTFTDGTITHIREINKAIVDGSYDPAAMTKRVTEVAWGVQSKIALGVIVDHIPEEIVENSNEEAPLT